MRALRSCCLSALIHRGEKDPGSSHMGSVDGPALDVVPVTPTHLISAKTLSHGTAPSKKGWKCKVDAGKEKGVGLAIL